ncbi:MAG TPA: hypothetical protein VMG10_28170 [Gemmataceae bacterium]|nr:hypothetical protein [Gemmataceae bacterium]
MRYQQTNERRAVILMVVLALLTLFAIVGITFVLYADAEAASARVARQAETQQLADVDPQQALAFFLSQLIYDVSDTSGYGSGLRGHSLARTMYGYNYASTNLNAFNGIGRLHYASPMTYPAAALTNVPNSFGGMLDDYALVNYTWFSTDPGGLNGAVRDPEHYGSRANPTAAQTNPYFGGNAPYTYPDLNSFFLAAVKADGTVLTPSFHRKWLFNPNNNFNDMTNANWINAQGKYLTLRPRPADHGNLFPAPDDLTGDVKNLPWAPGGNDSIWIDIGAPVMTAPDGTFYKMLVAPLIMDLDNRINLNTAGNIVGTATVSSTFPCLPHVSNQGWGGWEVNLGKILYALNNSLSAATQGNPTITMPSTVGYAVGDYVTVYLNSTPTLVLSSTIASLTANTITLSVPWTNPSGPVTVIDQEWTHLFTGRTMLAGNTVYGKYMPNNPTPPPPATPTTPNTPVPGGTLPHLFAQVDLNGLNETNTGALSTRPLLPGWPGTPPAYPNPPTYTANLATYPFAAFQQGYQNGGTELLNHPLLYNMFRPPWYNGTLTRAFRPSDMEPLLRPNMLTNTSPVDANSSALMSDLIRLCPSNFGPAAPSTRYRNLVTTLSMDLGAPGVTPYWWLGMNSGYLTANNANTLLPPVAATVPTQGTSVSFPPLPPVAGVTNVVGTTPPTSEFSTNWRALSANTQSYFLSTQPAAYTNPVWVWTAPNWVLSTVTTNPAGYTTPGARIRMNRPLPPYPHMGSGVIPTQPPAPSTAYGVAYNLTVPNVAQQYQAALNARQALANDIYRRLLAIGGIAPSATPNAPNATVDLAPRRWLAQLAVNIVDYIDEDDISTPFNFYTTFDGLPATSLGATQGTDAPGANALNQSGQNATGANPIYWVFGTEMPKVVLNEVLAEAQNPTAPLVAPPAGVTISNESVKLWVELLNTMPLVGGAGTQPQDNLRVPLWVSNPASGVAAGVGSGYSPYRITIAQSLMNQSQLPNPFGPASPLPDASANVLGKGYITSPPAPFPQSTTDSDFCPATIGAAGVPLSQDLNTTTPPTPLAYQATPAPGTTTVTAGVDAQNYFLIGPKTYPANPNKNNTNNPYLNPFASPGLPINIPVLQTDSLSYTPNPSWAVNPASTTDERTTGLTVLLRRLANPYLPYNGSPTVPDPNLAGNWLPNPVYNPYVTVDYIQNVPIRANNTLLQNPPVNPTYASRGKTQPYAGLTILQPPNTPPLNPTANYQASIPAVNSPVEDQFAANPPPAGAPVQTNNVWNTFGYTNYPLPPSGYYDWLVHLDRPAISPMELLHVSAWPSYMLTQRFILGSDNLTNAANQVNVANPANAVNMFGHYAPWLDYPPAGTVAGMVPPWWYDATSLSAVQSHRLYRLFEFLECGDSAFGANGLGRIGGKVNINTIWDAEILQALVDANPSIGITANMPNTPTNAADPVAGIFANLLTSRSPNFTNGIIGPVNMGSPTPPGDDHPFLPLSTGLYLLPAAGGSPQFPNGLSLSTDTLLRKNPTANSLLLFQNPTDTTVTVPHPYLQTQLLTKLYNKVTTRSNTFAVFVTVGFFQVQSNAAGQVLAVGGQPYVPGTNGPPMLGPEIGRSEGRQIRHRMFAIVDRTNLAAFSTTSSTPVGVPTVANPTGQAIIPLGSALPAYFVPGMQLVLEPGTANEETVVVQAVNGTSITANFTKVHPNPAVTGNPSATYQVILRGNPGPGGGQANYDPRYDPLVVPYFSIID